MPIWTPFGALALALAWVLPNASPPWLAFHKDAWLAAVLLVVAMVRVIRARRSEVAFRVDACSGLLLLMASMVVAQWLAGLIHFKGHMFLGLLYFAGASLAVVIGRQWEEQEPHQLGDFLFLALLLAAVTTTGLVFIQWLRLDLLVYWVQEISDRGRPYGNLNQPNNAATLLVLGVVAASWFAWRGRIRLTVWFALSLFLVAGLTLTGSRIGYLSFVSLVLLGFVITIRLGTLRWWRRTALMLPFALAVGLFLLSVEWHTTVPIEVTSPARVFERDLTTARVNVWTAYLHAALANPWFGYGFEQGLQTQLAAARLGHHLNGLYTWSHNALIDIATWFGIPMALLLLALSTWVFWRLVRAPQRPELLLYLGAIFAVVLHGMVELPLAFAYFLFPLCLLTGALFVHLRMPAIRLPRAMVAAWMIGLGGLFVGLVYDYFRIEAAFYTWRFERANIGRHHPMDIPDTLVLNQMEALLIGLRGTSDTLSSDDVSQFEKAVMHDPSAAALQHLVELHARRGDIAAAQRVADMAHEVSRIAVRKQMAARWRYLTEQDAALGAVDWKD